MTTPAPTEPRIEGWSWCDQHRRVRYTGANPCDRLHQAAPDAQVCGYHLRAHGPGEFGALCTAWEDVQRSIERQRWWNHLRR